MSERSWQLSLDAESDPKLQLLSNLVGKVVRGNSEVLAAQLSGNFQFATTFDDDSIEDLLEQNASSEFYNGITLEQKTQVVRILNLSGEAIWRYGSKSYTDGLWDFVDYAEQIPFERRDALVLTGAVGIELIGMNKRLDRLSTAIQPNLFERSVLLGGVALVEVSKRRTNDSESYNGPNRDGFVPMTSIGGTIHGDFWTSRQLCFQENAIDPTGKARSFGPSFENVYLPAYHSTETRIMSSLLGYQVGYQGVQRKKLFGNLVQKSKRITQKGGGAFADFGDDDGYDDASTLEHLIEQGVSEGDVLANLIVYPQGTDRLVLTAKKEGIEFKNGKIDYARGTFETSKSFVIPTEEIEDYVITLLGSGYGRTSQDALAMVIRTLEDGLPNRRRYDLRFPTNEE